MNGIQAIVIFGRDLAFGEDIEPFKYPSSRCKGMLREMCVAFGTKEFEGEKGKK